MPIEDIDFLGENSEIESTLFFLDSDSRDRKAYPTPAEYVIQFSEPVKLVVGLDILDATVPATMYVIDSHSDSLCASTLIATSDLGSGLEAQSLLSTLMNDPACGILSWAMTASAVTTLLCTVVDYQYSDSNVNASLSSSHDPVGGTQSSTQTSQFLLVVRQTGQTYKYTTYSFSSASAFEDAAASLAKSSILSIRKAVVTLQHGNYDNSTLMTHVATQLQTVASSSILYMANTFGQFDVVSSSSGSVSLQGRYAVINHVYPFVLDMSATSSTSAAVMGFNELPSRSPLPSSMGGYRCLSPTLPNGFGSVNSSSIPKPTFSSESFIINPVHVVVAPGIANLLGVRYITLRCPEIEQHLYSGMTYGSHSTGLGVLKLVPGNEISNLRFDFVSAVRRPFHPIGRLSRLTLRFERADGVLYDFKGINTQLLIAVKFLSPGKRVPLTRSVLNPDYDPDFIRYMLRHTASAQEGGHSGLSTISGPTLVTERGLGLFPSSAPYSDADIGCATSDGDGYGDGDGDDNDNDDNDDNGDRCDNRDVEDMSSSRTAVKSLRREIAQRLLMQQYKYDYPSAESDITHTRSLV